MIATKRSGKRRTRDYYATPLSTVCEFLKVFGELQPEFDITKAVFLDPCGGGDDDTAMPYPEVLLKAGAKAVDTIDIRSDSRAETIADYLTLELPKQYDAIFTQPPFGLGLEFIQKSLSDVRKGGYVGMLLRLDFYGTQKRRKFWEGHLPKWTIVHSRRPSFMNGTTDSGEYAHFVWQKGLAVKASDLIVI